MITGNVVEGLTEAVSSISPELADKIGGVIVVLKALGVVAIVYICYLIYMGFINIRRGKRLKIIEFKIEAMDEKLDILLKRMKKTKKTDNS